jgi:hypothetical protein
VHPIRWNDGAVEVAGVSTRLVPTTTAVVISEHARYGGRRAAPLDAGEGRGWPLAGLAPEPTPMPPSKLRRVSTQMSST